MVMKSYCPHPNLPDASVWAGQVCTLFKEGTNGWILVLKSSNKLAWMPKSYAKIFEGFACKYSAHKVEQGVCYLPVPSPQAEGILDAAALATKQEARALEPSSS